MRHVRPVTALPSSAALCQNFQSDFQVRLCFIFELLTGLFLPILQLKNPVPTGDSQ